MEDQTQALTHQGDGAAQAVAKPEQINAIEAVIAKGDLSKLTPDERVDYYRGVCESVGLTPFTEPFEYIRLSGKLKLYPTKGAADQLRKLNGISIDRIEKSYDRDTGLYTVTAYASDAEGRTDVDEGVVSLPRGGDALANAYMKALTKAKRRVTLSMCGLGMTDESEMHTIPSAEPVQVDHETGEIAEVVDQQRSRYERRLDMLRERIEDPNTDLKAILDKSFAHAREEWGWDEKQMQGLEEIAHDVQERIGLAPDAHYIPGAEEEATDEEEDDDAFEAALQELEIDMEAAAEEEETVEEKRAAVQAVAKAFSDDYQDAPEAQRVRISEVYSSVLNGISEEGNTQAADDMLEGKTALDPDGAEG